MSKSLSLSAAIAWIVGSTLFVTGGSYRLISHFLKPQPCFFLSRIVQTGPQLQALSTLYLAECMQLSADRPVPIAQFDPARAKAQLLCSPVIRQASVQLIEPDT